MKRIHITITKYYIVTKRQIITQNKKSVQQLYTDMKQFGPIARNCVTGQFHPMIMDNNGTKLSLK